MPPGTEGLVRALSSLAHSTETIINLLAILVRVSLESLSSNALGITPPCWVPLRRVNPDKGVNLADGSRSKHVVALWNNINTIFGGGSESRGNWDIGTNVAHDAVNRRVHAERLTNDGIKDWKLAEALICHRAERAIRVAEMVDLLLVKRFPMMTISMSAANNEQGSLDFDVLSKVKKRP